MSFTYMRSDVNRDGIGGFFVLLLSLSFRHLRIAQSLEISIDPLMFNIIFNICSNNTINSTLKSSTFVW